MQWGVHLFTYPACLTDICKLLNCFAMFRPLWQAMSKSHSLNLNYPRTFPSLQVRWDCKYSVQGLFRCSSNTLAKVFRKRAKRFNAAWNNKMYGFLLVLQTFNRRSCIITEKAPTMDTECLNSVLNVKGPFNQEKAFSVIVKTDCETDGSSAALL